MDTTTTTTFHANRGSAKLPKAQKCKACGKSLGRVRSYVVEALLGAWRHCYHVSCFKAKERRL